jgi:hypothetical protein
VLSTDVGYVTWGVNRRQQHEAGRGVHVWTSPDGRTWTQAADGTFDPVPSQQMTDMVDVGTSLLGVGLYTEPLTDESANIVSAAKWLSEDGGAGSRLLRDDVFGFTADIAYSANVALNTENQIAVFGASVSSADSSDASSVAWYTG